MKANFLSCLAEILKWEGGNDDDPHDPGGRTSRGITQREYDRFCDFNGMRRRDVFQAHDFEVQSIYQGSYWLPLGDSDPVGVDLVRFNIRVNCGDGGLAQVLARVRIKPVKPLIDTWIRETADSLREHYRDLHHVYFLRGWLNRANDVEVVALRMTKGG